MAYAVNDHELVILLQTAKDDVNGVELVIGDPFEWYEENGNFYWGGKKFGRKPMKKRLSTELYDYYEIRVSVPSRRAKYAFIITDAESMFFFGCRDLLELHLPKDEAVLYDLFGYYNFPYINIEDLIEAPEWSKNTVWYQIFLDRFHKPEGKVGDYLPFGSVESGITNHMFFGGDLNGVIEKIPYLSELGITGIYFTPIFKAYSAHKYDTEDYFLIDPSFGTNEDFKNLVTSCHKAGIKVMLDAVFNHCGFKHPYFQDVIANGKQSKYWDCFFIEDDHFIDFELDKNGRPLKHNFKPKYRTFAYTPHMPKLNTSNPVMQEYLLNVAEFWVKEYDIDGWRLDVSNEVSHEFWRLFRKRVHAAKKDVYILGENWDDSTPWLRGDQLDAVMNYEIAYPIWQLFGKQKISRNISVEEFQNRINKLLIQYPSPVTEHMFNLVDSHDTMRILTRVNGNVDLIKMSYLFIFTFPGSPAIYYGDEIGLEGKEDPDCRRCMIWDSKRQNHDLFRFFQKIIQLRKQYPQFQSTNFSWIPSNEGILAYQKDDMLIYMNPTDTQLVSSIPEGKYRDLIRENFVVSGQLVLSAYSMYILLPILE